MARFEYRVDVANVEVLEMPPFIGEDVQLCVMGSSTINTTLMYG